jgi:hypothetical protein
LAASCEVVALTRHGCKGAARPPLGRAGLSVLLE